MDELNTDWTRHPEFRIVRAILLKYCIENKSKPKSAALDYVTSALVRIAVTGNKSPTLVANDIVHDMMCSVFDGKLKKLFLWRVSLEEE